LLTLYFYTVYLEKTTK